jgi:hypothetical protein
VYGKLDDVRYTDQYNYLTLTPQSPFCGSIETNNTTSAINTHQSFRRTTTMDRPNTEDLVSQLVAGFDALQDEYKKLFEQQQTLERKLATAREQVRAGSKRFPIFLRSVMNDQLALDL